MGGLAQKAQTGSAEVVARGQERDTALGKTACRPEQPTVVFALAACGDPARDALDVDAGRGIGREPNCLSRCGPRIEELSQRGGIDGHRLVVAGADQLIGDECTVDVHTRRRYEDVAALAVKVDANTGACQDDCRSSESAG